MVQAIAATRAEIPATRETPAILATRVETPVTLVGTPATRVAPVILVTQATLVATKGAIQATQGTRAIPVILVGTLAMRAIIPAPLQEATRVTREARRSRGTLAVQPTQAFRHLLPKPPTKLLL